MICRASGLDTLAYLIEIAKLEAALKSQPELDKEVL